MFELPEVMTLARQMTETMTGKIIRAGSLGNAPHKFVWYNRSHDEFAQLTQGKTIGAAAVRGRWLCLDIEPGYVLVVGECGGKALFHPAGTELPAKYHLLLGFEDGSHFTVTTQMWGAMELVEKGLELNRQYIKDQRPTPVDPSFTAEYLGQLIDEVSAQGKRSVKGLLTQDQLIPGLGNSSAQDIMFRARLNPKKAIHELSTEQRAELHRAIVSTVRDIITQGGRYDEFDLHGNPGGYIRLMDKNALARPCTACHGELKKMQYLGGACYWCPNCQA